MDVFINVREFKITVIVVVFNLVVVVPFRSLFDPCFRVVPSHSKLAQEIVYVELLVFVVGASFFDTHYFVLHRVDFVSEVYD